MLEATSFEFDTRHPQQLVVKILQVEFGYDFKDESRRRIYQTAWAISMDLNYTFALLKQTTSALAISCIDLTHRLLGLTADLERVFLSNLSQHQQNGQNPDDSNEYGPYARFFTSPSNISETLMDLLDLYTLTAHRTYTFAGTQFPLETFMDIRIALNRTAEAQQLPRYAHWRDEESGVFVTPAYAKALEPVSHKQPAGHQVETDLRPGSSETVKKEAESNHPGDTETGEKAKVVAIRRFVLQPTEAVNEIEQLDEYFVVKEEEYEKEYEIDDGWETTSEAEEENRAKKNHPHPGSGKGRRR
jgi:CTD kinase subunit beta